MWIDDICFLQLQTGDPIEARYKEWTERGSAIDQLVYCINSFREAALSNDQKFDHIDVSEKQKVGQSGILFFFNSLVSVALCTMLLDTSCGRLIWARVDIIDLLPVMVVMSCDLLPSMCCRRGKSY